MENTALLLELYDKDTKDWVKMSYDQCKEFYMKSARERVLTDVKKYGYIKLVVTKQLDEICELIKDDIEKRV